MQDAHFFAMPVSIVGYCLFNLSVYCFYFLADLFFGNYYLNFFQLHPFSNKA